MSQTQQHAGADPDGTGRSKSVQSVDRALDVLEVLAAHDRPLGVSEIARRTALPQGTAHRLLLALLARGYARRDSERKYAVGANALRIADAAHRGLVTTGEQYLQRLVRMAGETSNLAILEGTHMVYAAQCPSPHTLRIFAEVGRRVPVHSTAVGKVALAGMAPAEAARVIDRAGLPARTPRTITRPADLRAELDRVAAQGFAIDDEEQELGVRCVAVPVQSPHGVVAAVSVSGPAERFSLERVQSLVEGMREIACDFSAGVFGSAGHPGP